MATATRYDKDKKTGDMGEHVQDMASNVADKAKDVASTVADKAKQVAGAVTDRADSAVSSAGSGIQNLAGQIRDRGPQSGMLGSATSTVANTLESTGRYLEEQGVTGMADDLTSLIKTHPIPAVLIGVGLGFMLARLTNFRS
jgi:ElaB/YqjD/DUF883 family membrane-anchored ribosome-binding protein